MPCDYSLYPKNWQAIRKEVLAREDNRCAWCRVRNHAYGYRKSDGAFVEYESSAHRLRAESGGRNTIRIVLTIAHLDHNIKNNKRSNLKALCQKCHNGHDAKERSKKARITRKAKKLRAVDQPTLGAWA